VRENFFDAREPGFPGSSAAFSVSCGKLLTMGGSRVFQAFGRLFCFMRETAYNRYHAGFSKLSAAESVRIREIVSEIKNILDRYTAF
jgi:hypothetical protein